ncbi:MAG: hypothetical protein ACRDK2_14530 [Solirubrobacteraceae bacterium]
MHDQSNPGRAPAPDINQGKGPAVVERAAFQAELDALRVREKAHTRTAIPDRY